ncbi:phosphotransferase enzyme family protein [Nocardia sp. NPDC004068]|uniref:phosphotransferase enzyme family protein n=1 Tax=Nocardia sp. NPDC004068 TaxID=3364303 RepID=UPI0036C03596
MNSRLHSDQVLLEAARVAGLKLTEYELVREGSHAVYRLAGDIVARIGRPGAGDAAAREVLISRWLNRSRIPTIEPVASIRQPTVIDGRPVTWWHLIPDHRPATPRELGTMLRALHALAPPTNPALPEHDPFHDLRSQLSGATAVKEGDRDWLLGHHDELRRRYDELPKAFAPSVIHADAWQGNLIVPPSGVPTLLDLDRVSLGRPEWDLVQLAADHADFDRIPDLEYGEFVDAYGGYDLAAQPSFRVLADIQELRWAAFALTRAETSHIAAAQADHRIACLRGEVAKPWQWDAL